MSEAGALARTVGTATLVTTAWDGWVEHTPDK